MFRLGVPNPRTEIKKPNISFVARACHSRRQRLDVANHKLIIATICVVYTMTMMSIKPCEALSCFHAIAPEYEGGRLGDEIYAYSLTKWFSYKYNIPFYAVPFRYSECFSIDTVDTFLNQDICKQFSRVMAVSTEDDLIDGLRTSTEPTLFKIRMTTGIHYASSLVENTSWPDMYTNLHFYSIKHPIFGSELRKLLTIRTAIKAIPLPTDKITVAVQVRKGSGTVDRTLASVQYIDEWKNISDRGIRNKKSTLRSADDVWPLKFPSEQFYVDQIIRLSNYFSNCPLFVHVFTDDPNPKQIIERFKQKINRSNISFSCRQEHTTNCYCNKNCIVEDIYNMSQFNCLIRPQSGLGLTAQLIGNHRIVIYPINACQVTMADLNQVISLVTTVGITLNHILGNHVDFRQSEIPVAQQLGKYMPKECELR